MKTKEEYYQKTVDHIREHGSCLGDVDVISCSCELCPFFGGNTFINDASKEMGVIRCNIVETAFEHSNEYINMVNSWDRAKLMELI